MADVEKSKVYYQLRFYDAGGVVFYQGEYGDCLYDVQQGRVNVYIDYGKATEQAVATLGPGDYFGEMAIIEAAPRTATIVAADNNTIVRKIDVEYFLQYAQENPVKVVKMMHSIGNRIKFAKTDYLNACETVSKLLPYARTLKSRDPELYSDAAKLAAVYEESLR